MSEPMDLSEETKTTESVQDEAQEQINAATDREGFEDISKGKGKLFKKIIKPGQGTDTPEKGCQVSVHYVGTLKKDGKKFDSSRDRNEPFEFTLGERSVIKGWEVGVKTMKKGEVAVFEISPEYGYGKKGSGDNIPPNAWLVFEIELLDWTLPDISEEGDKTLFMKVIEKGSGYTTPSDGSKVTVNYALYVRSRDTPLSDEQQHELIEKRENFEFVVDDEQVAKFVERCAEKMEKGVKAVFYYYAKKPIPPESLKYSLHSDKEKEVFAHADEKCLELHMEMINFVEQEREWQMEGDRRLVVANQMKEEGNQFFKQQRYELALKRYKRGVDLLSSDHKFNEDQKEQAKKLKVALHNNIAVIEFKRKNIKDVIKHCNKSLEIQSNNVKALVKRAQAHAANGDYDLAIQDLMKALEFEPESAPIKQELARMKQEQRKIDEKQREMYSRMFSA
jgi:FKBP-type peptidyl-prolyl cis-trans isomerase/tetratricopeptide (TPR) repeat protein